jgi:hypothetical protein
MLINARDPCQWTYLRNLPQKKKKKNPGINPGQVRHLHSEPAGKGREKKKKRKKTLVLTLGSMPEKGGKKRKRKKKPWY